MLTKQQQRNVSTVFARSDTTGTIYLFCYLRVATNREQRLLNSVLLVKSFINVKALGKASFIRRQQMPGSQSKETLPRLPLQWIASTRNQILSQMLKMTKMNWRRTSLYWRTANLFY